MTASLPRTVGSLTPVEIERDVRTRLFGGVVGQPWRVGAEVELIPLAVEDGSSVPVVPAAPGARSTLGLLRTLGQRFEWRERPTRYGIPAFTIPEAGRLSFEPGGQIEFSTVPFESPSRLMAVVRTIVELLCAAAERAGIVLLESGLDPANPVTAVPLQFSARRYVRMARYFGWIGEDGARMMRQTASCQLSVDVAPADVDSCWRALNTVAPLIVAAFANSPIVERRRSPDASARARIWQRVDPARTGIMCEPDHVREYVDFALGAPAFLLGGAGEPSAPLREHLLAGTVTHDLWSEHLTTLFPEIRPRGYLEVRGCDMIGDAARAALLVLVTAISRDGGARAMILEQAGEPSRERHAAAPAANQALLAVAGQVLRTALASAEREPGGFWDPADLQLARGFIEEFTLRGRTPADAAQRHAW